MNVEDVLDHLNSHEIRISVKTDDKTGETRRDLSSPDFLINEILTLYEVMKDAFERVTADREYDSIRIDQMTRLHKELITGITKLAELQGRLKGPGDAETKVLQVQGDLNLIMDAISGGGLCPVCEAKLMKKLEVVQNLLE